MKLVPLSLVLLVMLLAGTAVAEDKAEALFKKGKKLLAEKRYADACEAFAKSDELDPGIGAKLNTGKCFEEWGRLATAMRWYRDAEKLADTAHDQRVAKIHERIEALDPDVPRVTVRGPPDADPDSKVTIDGSPVTLGEAREVDPGPHLIEYISETGPKKKIVPVERGGSSDIKVDLAKQTAKQPVVTPPRGRQDNPGHGQRIAGIAVGSAGIVAIGIASVVTLRARSHYRDALASDCGGSTSMCDSTGLTATHDARHQANIATLVGALGALAVAGGVVIYLIAPKQTHDSTEHALYLAPSVGGDGGGLVLGGKF